MTQTATRPQELSVQTTLEEVWERLPPPARRKKKESIDTRFQWFHAQNPQVYQLLVRFARQAKRRIEEKNREFRQHRPVRYSIAAVVERARWEAFLTTNTDEPFLLPNDFRSRYSRLIMAQEPDLAGLFETRSLREGEEC